MAKPLEGDKLRNIWEMYESYIPRERWIKVLEDSVDSIASSENYNGMNIRVPQNAENDAQALRIGAILCSSPAAARAHCLLRRNGGAPISDDQVLQKLAVPDFAVRTMPRRKRQQVRTMPVSRE